MTDREKFEAWALANNRVVDQNSFGEYVYGGTVDGWNAWQASRKQAFEEAKDACLALTRTDGYWYDSGIENCLESIRALANPEGEQG